MEERKGAGILAMGISTPLQPAPAGLCRRTSSSYWCCCCDGNAYRPRCSYTSLLKENIKLLIWLMYTISTSQILQVNTRLLTESYLPDSSGFMLYSFVPSKLAAIINALILNRFPFRDGGHDIRHEKLVGEQFSISDAVISLCRRVLLGFSSMTSCAIQLPPFVILGLS
ncbi:uncharacterized protein LOC120678968 isoform X2 [Panicum virgatum]|uniref:uncharacterized protein LOC120678968 isoform X2 n=1 Tax=Panicum virgatum TaxID=38727 RepID=UPI0019D5A415|nr:uncharacterized protein LOC120678968 isoform X2 [Panicum virgatum]